MQCTECQWSDRVFMDYYGTGEHVCNEENDGLREAAHYEAINFNHQPADV